MEPGEALTSAAQIAVALAGFAGVVVAFRSSSLHEWSLLDKFRLWLLLGSALVPLFSCLFGMLLLTIKPTPFPIWRWCSGFSLLLICIFGFLSRRHQSELGPAVIKEIGAYRYLLCNRDPGDSSWPVAGLQRSALGRFLALLCRHHVPTGHRHFAICPNDSSAAAHEQELDSPENGNGSDLKTFNVSLRGR
jgi:hypothetical protein